MDIAIVLYDRFTALDAIGPYEVLSRLPGARVTFVAEQAGPVRTDNGMLTLVAERSLAELAAPGHPARSRAARGRSLRGRAARSCEWVRTADETSTWTTSVCTGSLILAAAGVLRGRRATSHWLAMDELAALGATPVSERVVIDGKIVTAAGVSAGIDMALTFAAEIAGETVAQAIQLGIEYDPQPPFTPAHPRARRPRSSSSCGPQAASPRNRSRPQPPARDPGRGGSGQAAR